ncbi:3-oxoacyl-[acyl-carrier-protein] synthase III C-terminal domain-containing protein, partial [Vibrio parahaemolyticus]
NPGDNMLLAAFGAGLTWGAAVLKWGDRVTPIGESDAVLPECEQSALELLERAIKLCNERRRDEV